MSRNDIELRLVEMQIATRKGELAKATALRDRESARHVRREGLGSRSGLMTRADGRALLMEQLRGRLRALQTTVDGGDKDGPATATAVTAEVTQALAALREGTDVLEAHLLEIRTRPARRCAVEHCPPQPRTPWDDLRDQLTTPHKRPRET